LKLLISNLLLSTITASYNILAIDGGGMRGIISAECIKQIETFAFNYATSQNYTFPVHRSANGRMHMSDLFDMMAGTSTGSILSASFSVHSHEN